MSAVDTTTDPAPSPRRPRRAAGAAALELAFHSDLRRIGERLELIADAPVSIGRLEPLFGGSDAAPLADPCVSRDQLRVCWNEARGAFEVAPGPGARRPLIRLDTGERIARATQLLPDTCVAIGDRMVLRTTLAPASTSSNDSLLGGSSAMSTLRDRIETFARSDAALLITGETGAGKELVARAVHAASARSEQPFVAVNCAALPETLLESELFGHVPGAFTGATRARSGVFRAAKGGTVLLDEVAELPGAAQAKLLRVLGDGSLRVVGQETEMRVQCRVIAATHRALAREVSAGRFRHDLRMRLSGCEIAVPPLRERVADIPVLFARFLIRALEQLGEPRGHGLVRVADRHAPPIPLEFFRALERHDWPGNVRELERLATACAALSARAGAFVQPPPWAMAPVRLPPDRWSRVRRATSCASCCASTATYSAASPARSACRTPRWSVTTAGARPPPPPDTTTDPVGKSLAFIAREYYFGARDPETGEDDPFAWRRIGFDIDGVDTNEELALSETPGTCLPYPSSRPDVLLDGEDGRDNAFGSQLLKTTAEFGDSLQSLEVGASKGAEAGEASLLVVLRGVGEGPDDPVVEVGLMTTLAEGKKPDWSQPEQLRDIDARSVTSGTVIPKLNFTDAYMTDHVVVAGSLHEPPPAPLLLPFDPEARPITLTPLGFVMTFELNESHTSVRRSTWAAVLSVSDLVALMTPAALRNGVAACDRGGQQILAGFAQPLADVSSGRDSFLDASSTETCDAISVGMQIDWRRSIQPRIDHVVDTGPTTDICAE